MYTMAGGLDSPMLLLSLFALFITTAVLLVFAGSQRRELLKATITLRHHVSQLNGVVQKLRDELQGPTGCKQQVRAWSYHRE